MSPRRQGLIHTTRGHYHPLMHPENHAPRSSPREALRRSPRWLKDAVGTSATAGMVVAARLSDGKGRRTTDPESALNDACVTVVVKTFLRPDVARRLVRSLRRQFGGRIVIADDSRKPMTHHDPLVDVVALPFNSGVAHGRNAALDMVTTEFMLLADDDTVFTAACDISAARAYLQENLEVDIVGFSLIHLPKRYVASSEPAPLFPGHKAPLRAHDDLIGGLPVRHKIDQVYLARTESIRKVRWDERLRMVDHRDFFSRASGVLITVLDEGNFLYHARTPLRKEYNSYRNDVNADLIKLAEIWSSQPG